MGDPEPPRPGASRAGRLVKKLFDRRFWTSTNGILGGLASAAAIVAIVHQINPGVLPFAGEEACESNEATLGNATITPGTLAEFVERIGGDPSQYDEGTLDNEVTWASVAVTVVGYKDKFLTLKWSMLDAKTGRGDDLPRNRTALEFSPPGCERTVLRQEVLLDPPIPPGREAFVAFDLVDEDGLRLPPEEARTASVRGRG